MTVMTPTPMTGRPAQCSDAEWAARRELAAIYNALVKYRLTDLTNQWHALRVPGEDALLTHHYGWMHEEVTASNLIKVGFDRTNHTPQNGEPSPSATGIGKLFFEANPEMNCIMHVHTKAFMGVSAQAEGVGPYSEAYLMIGGGDVIGHTDYEFECTDDFLSDLLRAGTGKKIIVEAWHGAFVFGTSAGEAFFRRFYLDQHDPRGRTGATPRRHGRQRLVRLRGRTGMACHPPPAGRGDAALQELTAPPPAHEDRRKA